MTRRRGFGRMYRALLRLLPSSAAEYARDIWSTTLRRLRARSAERDPTGSTGWWLRELVALAAAVASAWWDHARLAGVAAVQPSRLAAEVRTVTRSLVRAPVYTIAAVASLGIGVGATAGTGSLAGRTLFAALPFERPDELIQIYHAADLTTGISLAEMDAYRERATTMERFEGWNVREITFHGRDRPAELLTLASVTPELFDALGRSAALGRTFSADDRPATVVVSDRFWRSRLAGELGALGRTLSLGDEPHVVIGVLPPDVHVPSPSVDVYRPLTGAGLVRTDVFVDVLARLRAGSTLATASAEVDAIARSLPTAGSTAPRAGVVGGHATSLTAAWRPGHASLIGVTLAAAVVLLLAAVANVALLTEARARRREADRVVRRALGASSLDIARVHALEVGLLGLLAAALATTLALGLERLAPIWLPELAGAWPEGTRAKRYVILGGLAAAGLLALLGRPRPRADLRGRDRGPGRLLVPAQIAASMTLLTASALLVRSVDGLLGVDLGYRVDGVTTGRVSLSASYASAAEQLAFFEELTDRIGTATAGGTAGVVSSLPLSAYAGSGDVYLESLTPDEPADVIAQRLVDSGYFTALRIPLLAGRTFGPDDRAGTPRVVLVDEVFALRFFGSAEAALGERLRSFMGGADWNRIVGVVGAVRPAGPRGEALPVVYVPLAQRPTRSAHVVIAGAPGGGPGPVEILRREVAAIDPAVVVSDARSMSARLAANVAAPRLAMGLFGAFAAVTLFLTGLGSYAITALAHERREREIGVRKALGATPRRIVATTASASLRPLLVGLPLGALGGLAVARGLEGILFGVSALDPASFALAATLLGLSVAAASLPALRRSLALDAAAMLRSD